MGAAECISALSIKIEPFWTKNTAFLPVLMKNPSLTQFFPLGYVSSKQIRIKDKTQFLNVYLHKSKVKGSVIENFIGHIQPILQLLCLA